MRAASSAGACPDELPTVESTAAAGMQRGTKYRKRIVWRLQQARSQSCLTRAMSDHASLKRWLRQEPWGLAPRLCTRCSAVACATQRLLGKPDSDRLGSGGA